MQHIARVRRGARFAALALCVPTGVGLLPRAGASGPLHPIEREVALVDFVTLDTASTDAVTTAKPLRAGREYAIDVTGNFAYGAGAADGECSTSVSDPVWKAGRYTGAFGEPGADWLDVYVDGSAVAWMPVSGSGSCDPVGHHYRILYTPAATGPASFSLKDTYAGDNVGSLTVSVYILGAAVEVGIRP